MARRITADDVATYAELKGVPAELALAVWQQESSSGRNTKTSPKGAVGGFQIIPATFKRMLPGGDINDPVDNMVAGIEYLAEGWKKSGGSPEGTGQYYYHGAVLPAGKEGPNSGPGTPSTRQYGKQIADRMKKLGWNDPELDSGVKGSFQQPVYQRSSSPYEDPMARPYNMTEAGVGTYDFDSDPEETASKLYGEEDDDEELDQTEPFDVGGTRIDIAGLTRPLDMNPTMGGFGGMGDAEMGMMGQQNYELDKYVRRIVDEEFKNG